MVVMLNDENKAGSANAAANLSVDQLAAVEASVVKDLGGLTRATYYRQGKQGNLLPVRRAQAKNPEGLSGRQLKKQRKQAAREAKESVSMAGSSFGSTDPKAT